MVSPNQVTGTISSGMVTDDRGIRDPLATSMLPLASASPVPHHYYFWGGTIAGALAVISLSILSYALMYACRVGYIDTSGQLVASWGVGIWLAVTACIAYYVGGMISNSFISPANMGWLRGFAVWSLSIPLVLVLGAFVTNSTAQVTGSMDATHHVGYLPTMLRLGTAEAWTLFISLALGLIFAVIGGSSTTAIADAANRSDVNDRR